jgi:hypothetical protein
MCHLDNNDLTGARLTAMMQHIYIYIYIYITHNNPGQTNILIIIINSMSYKMRLRDRVFVPNTSMLLQTSAAEAHLTVAQFLLEQ